MIGEANTLCTNKNCPDLVWLKRGTMAESTEYDEEAVEPHEHDRDPSNVLLRAGYLRGMGFKLPKGEDRTFLLRASRSLVAYADVLRGGRVSRLPVRFSETKIGNVTLVSPMGNCDGSTLYKEDPTKEDYKGEKLETPCPGCRACK